MSDPVTESMDQKLDNELEELREKIRNVSIWNYGKKNANLVDFIQLFLAGATEKVLLVISLTVHIYLSTNCINYLLH